MRNNPTPSEKVFWEMVRKRQFRGLRFIRQHIFAYQEMDDKMRFHIVDFFCCEIKLIVEIDGSYHDNPNQIILDKIRTEILEAQGLKLIRFSNIDVLKNLKSVREKLSIFVKCIDDGLC